MKVENLMTRDVRTCSKHDSLEQAARIMWEGDVGCLVVVDEHERPIGMITDRDAFMAAYTQGVALRDARVGSAMSRAVHACPPDWSVKEVAQAMQVAQIRRMPVVNSDGKLIGVIGIGDLAHNSQSMQTHIVEAPGVAKTLACVTERRMHAAAE